MVFNQILVTLKSNDSYETGNLSIWNQYHDDHFDPLNRLIKESVAVEYSYLRNDLQIQVEIVTNWDSWGACEVCGRAVGDGIRRKKGHCRLKINPKKVYHNHYKQ